MDKTSQDFGTAERDRMRAAILRYMEEQKIGVPTLRERIAKATGRTRNVPSGKDPYTIDLKTLQRFLNNTHRTNDAFFVPLAQWLKDLPPPTDEVGAFADSAVRFFDSAIRSRREAGLFLGTLKVLHPAPAEKMRILKKGDDNFVPFATMDVSQDGAENILRVTEEVFAPDDNQATPANGYRRLYEGVAVDLNIPVMIILRNVMTGYPKSFWLYQYSDYFLGFCSERRFAEPDPTGRFDWGPGQRILLKVDDNGERDDS